MGAQIRNSQSTIDEHRQWEPVMRTFQDNGAVADLAGVVGREDPFTNGDALDKACFPGKHVGDVVEFANVDHKYTDKQTYIEGLTGAGNKNLILPNTSHASLIKTTGILTNKTKDNCAVTTSLSDFSNSSPTYKGTQLRQDFSRGLKNVKINGEWRWKAEKLPPSSPGKYQYKRSVHKGHNLWDD